MRWVMSYIIKAQCHHNILKRNDCSGRLILKSDESKSVTSAHLFVGGKELLGKVVRLSKPILVCAMVAENSQEVEQLSAKPKAVMKVFSVVREKIVFEGRPIVQWT